MKIDITFLRDEDNTEGDTYTVDLDALARERAEVERTGDIGDWKPLVERMWESVGEKWVEFIKEDCKENRKSRTVLQAHGSDEMTVLAKTYCRCDKEDVEKDPRKQEDLFMEIAMKAIEEIKDKWGVKEEK